MKGAAIQASRGMAQREAGQLPAFDPWLLGAAIALLCIGLVMVGSASIAYAERMGLSPFHYLERQIAFAAMGLLAAYSILRTRLVYWERAGGALLVIALILLLLVLVPGIGRTVNGATRWLPLGLVNLQVSELAKLFVIIYLAGYLVRRGDAVRTTARGFFVPMGLLSLVGLLFLLQPDFGATVVLFAAALGMLFLGGVRLWLFGAWLGLVLAAFAILAVSSPYRLKRITSFLDPWQDPFNSGFQLTQSLIAIGRGEWFGVGLGSSIQKLSYLPEAHTDFLFAILGEEFGLAGTLSVIGLFALLVQRSFSLATRAEREGHVFAAHLGHGLGLWLGVQAFINIGVNMGVLPTKGLTLPLMSYGGSSMVVSCMVVALLLRIDYEVRHLGSNPAILWRCGP